MLLSGCTWKAYNSSTHQKPITIPFPSCIIDDASHVTWPGWGTFCTPYNNDIIVNRITNWLTRSPLEVVLPSRHDLVLYTWRYTWSNVLSHKPLDDVTGSCIHT